ncbi:MAG: PilT/PilU family type 4a pilus ATPase [Candidatus Roizmanbacteria bacterium]|nr:PilT/PilU family type 4a pilus ATPase [Candidatus Roizmanbacteria bacterium]
MNLEDLFKFIVEKRASDLHITPGYRPTIRLNDKLLPIQSEQVLDKDGSKLMLFSILSSTQKEELETNREIDFGLDWKEVRFRANYYYMRGAIAASFRLIPQKIATIEELSLPNTMHKFSKMNEGLVLLTGPTGEGKSTTIAAILDEINSNYQKHVITIEDPIEFVYTPKQSIISQRELHSDTHSFPKALRSVLREDPDVVLIGEMRDFETIQAALTIAETGHLVFSTLHTGSTPEAVNRIVDVFPGAQQNQIRAQLASVLKSVVYQRLIPNVQQTGRVPALEILFNTSAVSALIREGKAFMIDNVLETGEEQEMIIFEKYLSRLYKQNMISRESAFAYAMRKKEITKFVK